MLHELASALESQDHTADAVPLSERRSSLTMGLLWVTMMTGFPTVLIGFEWYKARLTLEQVLFGVVLSNLVLLGYALPACLLGSRSGQTYALLSRRVFGRWGSRLVSCNAIWVQIGWYGLMAIFLGDGLKGLFHWSVPSAALSAGLAVAMAANNMFGFSGIANFARYLAAPVLILWVGVAFGRATLGAPAGLFGHPPVRSFASALTIVSSFVVGYGAWGNEPDYWRFGRPGARSALGPILVAIVIGQMIFPTTGWLMARMSGVTDYGGATALMNRSVFGGVSIVAAVVLVAAYFAVNDSGLYGAINGLSNLRAVPRRRVVVGLALVGASLSAWMSGREHSFEAVASLSSVVLPCATVVMLAEFFLLRRRGDALDFAKIPRFEDLPPVRWPALGALVGGCVVGVGTSGVVPGTERWHVGVCSLQAWATSLCLYLLLRWLEARSSRAAFR